MIQPHGIKVLKKKQYGLKGKISFSSKFLAVTLCMRNQNNYDNQSLFHR